MARFIGSLVFCGIVTLSGIAWAEDEPVEEDVLPSPQASGDAVQPLPQPSPPCGAGECATPAPAAEPPSAFFPMAPAQPEPERDRAEAWSPPRQRTERRWYGHQTLLVDGASIAALFADPGLGAGGLILGGPVVHTAHGHVGKALGSLGLRVGAPIAGGAAGMAFEGAASGGCSGEWGCLRGAVVGFFVGAVSAIAIDSAVLANEDVPASERGPSVGLKPSISIGKRDLAAGLTGWF